MRSNSWRMLFLAAAAVVLACGRTEIAKADNYPSRVIQVVVSYPAGGAYDTATRILAPQLQQALGQALVIVPKPGAAGSLGLDSVLRADPDGYSVSATATATLTLNPHFLDNIKYTVKDVIPIGILAVEVNAIVVKADAKWKTFDELLDDAAKNPGKLTYGSPGAGSVSTTVVDAIKAERKLSIVNVPFVGSPAVNLAVLGGQVDFGTTALTAAAPMIDSGQLRLLAVGGKQRVSKFPDVKTFNEFGLKAADLQLRIGLFVSSKTPPDVVEKLSAAFSKAVSDPVIAEKLSAVGLLPSFEDSRTAQATLLQEAKDVDNIVKSMNAAKN